MNLKQLKERIDFICKVAVTEHENLENLEVVITTNDSSVGGRAKTKVKSISRGIDWEHMQIRIDTEDNIIKEKNNVRNRKICWKNSIKTKIKK